MAPSPRSLPGREEELALHQRLLERDPVAPAELAERYLVPLNQWLAQRSDRHVCRDWIEEAAGEALVSLMKSPEQFDPARSRATLPLLAFLRLAAKRDLQNLLQKETNHRRHYRLGKSVEDLEQHRNCLREGDNPSVVLEQEEIRKADGEVLATMRDGLDERELRVLELILEGERKTSRFAEAMGIEHEPKDVQEVAVKREKDKLRIRLRRAKHGRAP